MQTPAVHIWHLLENRYNDLSKSIDRDNIMDINQIKEKVATGTAIVLDVRTDNERAGGYAEGSLHIELIHLDGGVLPQCSPNTEVFVYCRSGGRAGMAKQILESAGFENVTNIGGLSDWEQAGGEVVR